jgi:hypothetical protein
MPRCYVSLALAASSHPRSAEDRLTELYAVALEIHPGFASRVFALVDLPPAERYEAFTQHVLDDGSGRVDLRVRGFDANGEPVAILYAEHKEPGGHFQEGQPQKYLSALELEARESGAESRFLVVVGERDDAEEHGQGPRRVRQQVAEADEDAARIRKSSPVMIDATTWQAIANCAELAGRDAHAGGDKLAWREAAAAADAPASQRLLCELLWYFEEEGYAMTNGLTAEQLAFAPQAIEIEDTLRALLDATTALLLQERFGRFRLETPRGGGQTERSQDFRAPAGSWLEKWKGGLWWGYGDYAQSDRSVDERKLAFAVGLWLQPKEARRLDQRKAFRVQLEGFELHLDDEGTAWTHALASSFVKADAAETMDDQARRICEWATPRLGTLLQVRPGPYPR